MDCSRPGASAHGLFMQEYWSKLPGPPPGDPPDPGIWRFLHWQPVSLPLAPPGKSFLKDLHLKKVKEIYNYKCSKANALGEGGQNPTKEKNVPKVYSS